MKRNTELRRIIFSFIVDINPAVDLRELNRATPVAAVLNEFDLNEFVVCVEDEFDIFIDDPDLDAWKTLGDIEDYILENAFFSPGARN